MEKMMALALAQARLAAVEGEIPVGAVLVRGDQVLAQAHNRREATHDPTGHAEIQCLREGAQALGDWRLRECTLYVTLEPCPMCAGGIINSRIETVRYGVRDEKAGACGSVLNLFEERFNHHPRLYRGPLEEECRDQLQEFFLDLREKEGFSRNV